jgi:adenosylmethionine-8-amino-7-oxononanoate aminotransferase
MEEKHSISIYPGTGTADGKLGDHVLLSPAYNVTREEVELIVDRAAQAIDDYFSERNFANEM